MITTIFIPISRGGYLPKLFHALEVLQCDPERTSLFTYVDGPADLFVTARNFTESSRFAQRPYRLMIKPGPHRGPVPDLHAWAMSA